MIVRNSPIPGDLTNVENPAAMNNYNEAMEKVGVLKLTGMLGTRSYNDWQQLHNVRITESATAPLGSDQLTEAQFFVVANRLHYVKLAG
jgi:hypothetical protein